MTLEVIDILCSLSVQITASPSFTVSRFSNPAYSVVLLRSAMSTVTVTAGVSTLAA